MALETGTFISDLVATNPTGSDPLAFADDHLRLLKSTLKNTFPNVTGAVSKTHTEINTAVDQAAAALPKAGGTLTGPLVLAAAPTVTLGAATKGYVDTTIQTVVDAHTVSTAQIENAAVTEAKLASGVAAANLGFNPIQQGGGTGQLANKVYIGWSGSQLKAQVDATDMGGFVMQPAFTDHSLSGNGYQKLPGGLIMQWGSASQTSDNTTVSFPIAFPNACLNVQQTILGSSVSAPGIINITTTSFVSQRDPAVGNVGVYYFAIGY